MNFHPRLPKHQVCPLCGHDDDVSTMPLPGGDQWQYSCTDHTEPYVWIVKAEPRLSERNGITAELGLYDDLPRCLMPDEPFVEHGVIEYRYKLLRPDVYFDELLPRYGHVANGPRRYSTTAFIASALGRLAREGDLTRTKGPATGCFAYNGRVGYWAHAPGPEDGALKSWDKFAADLGISAAHWSLERRSDES
jgi:hypothetical protein